MRPSLNELVDKYKNNLYAVAFNICKNPDDAVLMLSTIFSRLGFLPGDDLAAFIPVFDFVDSVVVIMPVGDQDQVRRKVIAFSGVGINVDDLSFPGDDPQAAMPLIEEFRGSRAFRRGDAAAQQQGEKKDTAQCSFHAVFLLF